MVFGLGGAKFGTGSGWQSYVEEDGTQRRGDAEVL
jgi:hypothetical protein